MSSADAKSHATGTGGAYLTVDSIDTYYGDSHILHNLSIEVHEGEVVSLLGRNGVGKTTTLRSIMGLTKPRSGAVTFKGTDITRNDPNDTLRMGIALVPESRVIFPNLTVRENLAVPVQRSNVPPEKQFSVDDIYEMFPRLDERRAQLGSSLSGGEQQMLTIGRSLMTNPDLLMLDEPSEGLAPQIVADVRDIIERISDLGMTIILVEQNVKVAQACADRHYILEKGAVQYEGRIEDLSDERKNELLGVR